MKIKLRWTVAALALVVVVAAALLAAVFLWATRDWDAFSRPEGVILTFEVDRESMFDGRPVDMLELIAAVDRRLGGRWRKQAQVRHAGDERIEVVTFTTDPGQLRRIEGIVRTLGTLEFRILANRQDHSALIEQALKQEGRALTDGAGELLAWWVPVATGREEDFANAPEIATRTRVRKGGETLEVLVVKDIFDVTGQYVVSADPSVDQWGKPALLLTFNEPGGQLFGGLTGNNLPDEATGFSRKLGILLDGSLYSAPAIRSTIFDRAEITGDFTRQDVEDLAQILNAGSLPAPLKPLGQRLADQED
ncbi:MAG TPA: hypothetical protein VMY37_19440 [Thermoguttaceae bacterium]|nr:hypothetical protein [Thermoguttaceae bacterium]